MSQFEYFGCWIISIQTMFQEASTSVTRPHSSSHLHFEDEMFGGLVTFNKFQAIPNAKLL
jgi:hypothetical protein